MKTGDLIPVWDGKALHIGKLERIGVNGLFGHVRLKNGRLLPISVGNGITRTTLRKHVQHLYALPAVP